MNLLLAEWQHEAASTRKILERVPEAHLSWKPHEKSMSLGGLATHVANLTSWAGPIFEQTEYTIPAERMPEPKTSKEILELFERNSTQFIELLGKGADMGEMWTLKAGDHTIFTMPRGAVIRSFLLSHLIHHRAQLTVYLRLLDVTVPGLYGPSADEKQEL